MTKMSLPILVLLTILGVSSVHAAVIDLRPLNFSADPEVDVDLSGGLHADFTETGFTSTPAVLANDPWNGNDQVIFAELAGVGQILSFDYNFSNAGTADEFGAFIMDYQTGLSVGSEFEFHTTSSGAASVSFDLSTLSGADSTWGGPVEPLGLQFELWSHDGVADGSELRVSNVQLNPVPVPGAVLLAGLGLATSAGVLRKKRGLQK